MRRWLIALGIVFVVLVAGAFTFYKIALEPKSKPKAEIVDSKVVSAGPVDGRWVVTPGSGNDDSTQSWVGYRIGERIAHALSGTIVGRSHTVTGGVNIEGRDVSDLTVSADATKFVTGNSLRDSTVQNVMDTGKFPTARFTMTTPLQLAHAPVAGERITENLKGDLTIHGVTRHVTVHTTARWDGSRIQVIGEMPFTLAQYDLHVGTIPGIAQHDDFGTMELQLFLQRQS